MKVIDFLTKNMTATATVIQSGVALAVLFGLHLSTEQVAGIMTFTTAALAFIAHRTDTPDARAEKVAASQRNPS